MANPFASTMERLSDRWEQMAPRERRLVAILVSVLAVGIAFYVAIGIRNGLSDLEQRNEARREALRALQLYDAGAAAKRGNDVKIPGEPIKLDRYVDGIIQAAGIDSPRYPQPKDAKKNEFVERSFKLSLPKLTIAQLRSFLEKLETGSKVVVVKELHIKRRSFSDEETLDVDVVVATYYKPAKSSKDEESDDADEGDDG